MREFQRKKKVRNILYSWVTVVVLALVAALLAKAVWSLYGKERQSAQAAAEAKSELGQLQTQQAELSEDYASLSTSEGVERDIRENFNMAKNGEQLVIVVGDATATPSTPSPEPGFFGRIWQAIVSAF